MITASNAPFSILRNGVRYEYLACPAYKHLSRNQAVRAVQLSDDIMVNRADLHGLNSQLLNWRGK